MSFGAQRLGWGASSAFSPITRTYAGVATLTETIPSGASQVVIEGWGPGGSGGRGYGQNGVGAGGGGGGAGGYFKKTIAGLTSADWNKTLAMAAQDTYPALASVSSGTYSLTTLTAYQGNPGAAATGPASPGAGGTGGTATNGDTNTTGGNGSAGTAAPVGGTGATGTAGTNGGPYGHGGNGQDYANDHSVEDHTNTPAPGLNVNRSTGAYVFYYT
jgi:hypothetical protein